MTEFAILGELRIPSNMGYVFIIQKYRRNKLPVLFTKTNHQNSLQYLFFPDEFTALIDSTQA